MVDESAAEGDGAPAREANVAEPAAPREDAGGQSAAAEAPAPGDAPPAEAAETPEALREALADARSGLEAAQDQVLRAQAEADNTRRRAAREMENARKFAVERLTADILPAIDSFERAVEAAREASEATAAEGVELSLKLLLGALERAGVRVVDPLGAPFDPRFHEAISMVENADAEPGAVTQVVQKGYVLNERVVRAAMVIVAKAPAGAAADEPGDAAST